ncbi:MAG TPA: GtrA family protein, partial [Turneriella sp.]|nr:GtrA family protein [Turneriella sp.]
RAGADLVVGTRKANGGQIENWSLLRRFISWGATKMAHFFLPQNSSDPMSGFFAVSKNFYNRIATEINPRGFKILLEILAHARGANMQEVGYSFRPRQFGESKLSVSVAFTYLVALYDLKFGRLIPVRFIKYALVGASGVVVNQLVLFLSRSGFKLSDAIALGVALEISIFWNFIVNNYFTFKDKSIAGVKNLLWGFLKFNFVCLGGAFINYSITMSLVASFMRNIYLANLVGIGVSTIWNYFINLQITWKRELD